jgi:hypothetical protein
MQDSNQRFALLGGGRESDWANRKNSKRRKLLENGADSPPSSARFVVRAKTKRDVGRKKDYAPDRLDQILHESKHLTMTLASTRQ